MALPITLAAGVLIGLLLGMLGAGGSIIAIPALTLGAGLPLREAITTALVVVLAASLTAALPRLRSGVQWSTALMMTLIGVPFTMLGTTLSHRLDETILVFGLVGIMLSAAVVLLKKPAPKIGSRARSIHRSLRYLRIVAAGAVVGTLTGLFGVGGGFLIVPILTLFLGLPMQLAVGTSLVVIFINSTTGLAAQLTTVSLDWVITAAFAITTMTTAKIASKYGMLLSEHALRRSFCSLIVIVSATMLVTTLRAG
ncbi:MAG: sulfite exporter TauE/SafE family protein [Rhodococcus sp. (in: high G+C Gram-positive bacteria)]